MTIVDKAMLVTGANRGIGQTLAAEALSSGAKEVDAGTRRPGPPGSSGHAPDPGGDQRGADPGGRRSARVDDPQPPAGPNQRGTQMELASSMEELTQDRTLDRLTWLAAAISSGHHLDHLNPPGELGGTPRSR